MSNFSSRAKTISITSSDSAPNSSRRESGVSRSIGNVERFRDYSPDVIDNCQRVPRSRCCSSKSNIAFQRSHYSYPALNHKPLRQCAMGRSRPPVGNRVSAFGRCIERFFQHRASLLQHSGVRILRNADRFADDNPATAERQVDFGAIPIVEHDPATGRQADRKDRSARTLRASLMMPRPATRETFGTSAVNAMFQPWSSNSSMPSNPATPPLMWNRSAMISRTANRADAEPLGGDWH